MELMPIDRLNVCAQHRDGSNPIQQELNSSIAEHGVDSPILTTIADRRLLEEYIEFTNDTWGGEVDIDDCVPYDEAQGTFVLLVAGHSRLTGCEVHAAHLGVEPEQYPTYVRVKDLRTVDEIVACQVRENIHSASPPQNVAKAIAESWLLQKRREAEGADRVTKKEFAKGHRVSMKTLSDALHYVELPREIRQLSEERILPFSVAVEIGRASATVKEWAGLKAGKPEDAVDLHRTELIRLTTCYLRHEKTMMATNEIRARVKGYKETIGGDEAEQQPLDDFMSLVAEPSELERARARLEADVKTVDRNLRDRHLRLFNSIAHLAELEGTSIHEGHISEIVEEGRELLEGRGDERPVAQGELREGETVQVG